MKTSGWWAAIGPVTILAIVAIVCLPWRGCMDAHDQRTCLETVEQEYPGSDIMPLHERNSYCYVVREKDGSVWWVECLYHTSAKISHRYQLLPAKVNK